MIESVEAEFPALFCHPNRADWGVGVFSGERDGKRAYLFEGGEERLMGKGSLDMMRKVTSLDDAQRSTLMRLTALVARRHGSPDASKGAGVALVDQVATLRRAFPKGLVDPAWQSEKRAAHVRDTLAQQAQKLLSLKALDAQLRDQQFDAVWGAVKQLLGATRWVPADQLDAAPVQGLGLLAGAVRELFYGSATLEQRVDRFSVAFEATFRRLPRWETTTGLLSLVAPESHVLVELALFRKQLKLLGAKGTLPQTPSGAGYVRCLNVARNIASKLTEQGETVLDLLDVHDFVRFTLKASAPARRPSAAKAPKKSRRVEDEGESEDSSSSE
jgi:hypothetical protein